MYVNLIEIAYKAVPECGKLTVGEPISLKRRLEAMFFAPKAHFRPDFASQFLELSRLEEVENVMLAPEFSLRSQERYIKSGCSKAVCEGWAT